MHVCVSPKSCNGDQATLPRLAKTIHGEGPYNRIEEELKMLNEC